MTNVHYGVNDAGDHGQQTHDKGARAVLPDPLTREAEPAETKPVKKKETGID